jgi:hypothetical protein
LVTTSAESDGEIFPMHESRLFALSDTRFYWSEWPTVLEFQRDATGAARSVTIDALGGINTFRGLKRRPSEAPPGSSTKASSS